MIFRTGDRVKVKLENIKKWMEVDKFRGIDPFQLFTISESRRVTVFIKEINMQCANSWFELVPKYQNFLEKLNEV